MTLVWPKPNRTFGAVDALGITGLTGLLVARFIPLARWLPFWGCALRERTGWPCLGCGLTRAADRVAHGNLAGAWEANPLGAVAAVVFALLALWTFLHLTFAVPVPELTLSRQERWAARALLAVAVVVNYAVVVVHTRFPWLLG